MKLPVDELPDEPSTSHSFSIYVSEKQAGVRLDHFLVKQFPELSRSQLAASVTRGLVSVGGNKRKNSYRLKSGEEVIGSVYVETAFEILAEKIDFDILYEDAYLLVISKPPNLVVHPGSGNHSGTLVNGLIFHCQAISEVGDPVRPGIVHRLDKDTSGVMVIAKNEQVLRQLSYAFKERQVTKRYHALVHGIMIKKEGRLVASIGRHVVKRQKMAVREKGGKYAVSNWKVLEEFGGQYSLVEITIETGRTHQIRVHMAHLGHPVTGDLVYGKGRRNQDFRRQMLHASRLTFIHPVKNKEMDIIAPFWPDFKEHVDMLRKR